MPACRPPKGSGGPKRPRFHSEYVHYRTGKLMKASDYGYKGWPF